MLYIVDFIFFLLLSDYVPNEVWFKWDSSCKAAIALRSVQLLSSLVFFSTRSANKTVFASRMQGFLLDTLPTKDLDLLRTSIKDASNRVERAAFSRRISSIPSLSFEDLDTDSTQDIYALKGLESDD